MVQCKIHTKTRKKNDNGKETKNNKKKLWEYLFLSNLAKTITRTCFISQEIILSNVLMEIIEILEKMYT